MKERTISIMLAAAVVAGCATPTVVQTAKPGDAQLSCAQLQNEYADADRFRWEARRHRGLTGGNVARAILFWPAVLGTFANANEAIAAADTRKVYLANIMNQQNCPIPGVTPSGPSQAPRPAASHAYDPYENSPLRWDWSRRGSP